MMVVDASATQMVDPISIDEGAKDSAAVSSAKPQTVTNSTTTGNSEFIFGAIAELSSGNPVLYINVPEHGGRIKLVGSIVYPAAPLLTLQLSSTTSQNDDISCTNFFDNMVVFDNISWIDDKESPVATENNETKLKGQLEAVDVQKEGEKFEPAYGMG